MRIHVGCEFIQTAPWDVHTVLQVEVRPSEGQVLVHEEWDNAMTDTSTGYVDTYGNRCRRITLEAGASTIRYDAWLDVPPVVDQSCESATEWRAADLPDEVLLYTLPSRFCPSDELATSAFQLFGPVEPGWTRVQAIVDWVHNQVAFDYANTHPFKTASDVLYSRQGVCRDYAHLAIAFCRALTIPARYAFGYLPNINCPPSHDVMDFCAWMEVFLEGRWWTFDPRNNDRRIGRILIGRGRDALDVAMVTSFGALNLDRMTVWADEDRTDPPKVTPTEDPYSNRGTGTGVGGPT